MSNYSKDSQESLFEKIKYGDDEAMDILMDQYSHLVKGETRKLFLVGADEEDLIQEGMIGLFKAVCRYEQHHDVDFEPFAILCIRRQLYSMVTASNRKKHRPLNHYVSLWSYPEDGSDLMLDEVSAKIPDTDNPENLLLRKEQMEIYYHLIEEKLSDFEKEVVNHYIRGESYTEIAEKMGKDVKSIDNAIQRIRKKLSTSN